MFTPTWKAFYVVDGEQLFRAADRALQNVQKGEDPGRPASRCVFVSHWIKPSSRLWVIVMTRSQTSNNADGDGKKARSSFHDKKAAFSALFRERPTFSVQKAFRRLSTGSKHAPEIP